MVRGKRAVTHGPAGRAGLGARTRALAASGALLLGSLGLTSCASVRNELGTAQSACYVDLAQAAQAVHHAGKLRGVRLVSTNSLRAHAPLLFDVGVVHGKRVGQVCLVAFGGHFHSDQVSHPIGKPEGDLAIVAFGYPDKELLATLVVTRLPLPFGHFRL